MAKLDKLTDGAQAHLDEGEAILAAVQGTYETKSFGTDSVRSGVLVATEKRVVFYAKKLTGYDLESFPYSNISSIEMGKNVMGHHIKLFASGNEAKMKWIQQGDMNGFVETVRARMGKSHTPAPVAGPDAPAPSSIGDQIKSIAELRDQGILTEEEFQAKKAELLARL